LYFNPYRRTCQLLFLSRR